MGNTWNRILFIALSKSDKTSHSNSIIVTVSKAAIWMVTGDVCNRPKQCAAHDKMAVSTKHVYIILCRTLVH